MRPPKVQKSAGACGTWVLVLFIGGLLEGTSNKKIQAPESRKHPPILQLLEAPFCSFPLNCYKKQCKTIYQNGFTNASNAKHSKTFGIPAPGHVPGPVWARDTRSPQGAPHRSTIKQPPTFDLLTPWMGPPCGAVLCHGACWGGAFNVETGDATRHGTTGDTRVGWSSQH